MHAHQNIQAVKKEPLGGSISAAMEHPAYRSVSRIMANTGLDQKLVAKGSALTVAEVDRAFADCSRKYSFAERVNFKSTLSRMGLLP